MQRRNVSDPPGNGRGLAGQAEAPTGCAGRCGLSGLGRVGKAAAGWRMGLRLSPKAGDVLERFPTVGWDETKERGSSVSYLFL